MKIILVIPLDKYLHISFYPFSIPGIGFSHNVLETFNPSSFNHQKRSSYIIDHISDFGKIKINFIGSDFYAE